MKKLLLVFPILTANATTPVAVFVVGAGGQTPPSTTQTAQLTMTGVDTISVTINGTSFGRIRAPFTVTYTALPAGQNNVFVIDYCDFMGRLGTDTFTIMSQVDTRTFPGRVYR